MKQIKTKLNWVYCISCEKQTRADPDPEEERKISALPKRSCPDRTETELSAIWNPSIWYDRLIDRSSDKSNAWWCVNKLDGVSIGHGIHRRRRKAGREEGLGLGGYLPA